MRNILLSIICIILLCFIIPIVFTKSFKEAEQKKILADNILVENMLEESVSSVNTYNYKEYNTIKLLHTKTNIIEEINLDDYLLGVVSAEMPASFEIEALKAQALVARTYTMYKIINSKGTHDGADICDDFAHCQAWISKADRLEKWEENVREEYWQKIVTAVNETKGKIITYENKPINAFFHANSGGQTEVPINVWGGSGYPYLQVVQTAGEDAYSQYNSEVILTKEEVTRKNKR